jgi:hypothetical protein
LVAALVVVGVWLMRQPPTRSRAVATKRIAVLPFENLGAPEDDDFADAARWLSQSSRFELEHPGFEFGETGLERDDPPVEFGVGELDHRIDLVEAALHLLLEGCQPGLDPGHRVVERRNTSPTSRIFFSRPSATMLKCLLISTTSDDSMI